MKPRKNLTYKDSGVDISSGERAVELIREKVSRTFIPGVLTEIGGFGSLFSLRDYPMEDPVLVSGADGVGTKLKVAFMMNRHDTVGIDAVAMCANDVITTGARPLFFLDYIGTGRLDPGTVVEIVDGLAEGCRRAGCALVGGETAEMPGIYAPGEYDLAGFCVGIVERTKIIDGTSIRPGDAVIGLPSSGLHSNGFSLVRKVVFEVHGMDPFGYVAELGAPLGDALLEPTVIYADAVLKLVEKFPVGGIAHVTGGGLAGNLSRVIPVGLKAEIVPESWTPPPVFGFIRELGGIAGEEMNRVFNMGIGMALVVPGGAASDVLGFLSEQSSGGFEIGRIAAK
ncbi:MAG: phosphoribosylformylglycinamidine cyclo-ligase [bacterium]